jgi:hypothetical protein
MALDDVTLELRTREQVRVALTDFPLLESDQERVKAARRGARRGRLPRLRGQPLRGLELPGSPRRAPGASPIPATTGRSRPTPISPKRSRSSRGRTSHWCGRDSAS